MRTIGILLLLLLLCIGFCSAYPNKQDNDLQQIGSKEGNSGPPYALTLRRQTRTIGSFISNEIQQLLRTIYRIPVMIAELIRNFIFAILDVFQLFLSPFQTIMNGIVRTKREGTSGLVGSLLFYPPQMIFHPFEFVEDSIKASSNFARNLTGRVLQNALRIGWRFLATTGLPWLRRILDQVAKMPTTPDYVRTLIKNFDTMYNILQMLGYISPAY